MERETIINTVSSVIRQEAKTHPEFIDPDASLQNEYGFDSISIIELIMSLENAFCTEFPDSELIIEKYGSVNQVADIIERIIRHQGRSLDVK